MPRPRLHLIRFHGVLAPNAKLRSLVVPQGPRKDEQAAGVAASGVQCEAETVQVRPARISWARLLKRVFDIDMQRCPHCGAVSWSGGKPRLNLPVQVTSHGASVSQMVLEDRR